MAVLHRRGLAPASVARRVAAVRGLHRFAVTEGLADLDPTVLVDSPRRRASLPKALGVDEVERLLAAPDPATAAGQRDRALLEFLYATGARIAEAVALDQMDLDLEGGTARLTGKGDKQRVVPLGGPALRALAAYLPDRLAVRRPVPDP